MALPKHKLYSEAEKIEITNRMADKILEHLRGRGECGHREMIEAGFNLGEISKFFDTAYGFAVMSKNNAEH